MLRTDSFGRSATVKSLPRVGAGTRSVRSGASPKRRARVVRDDAVEIQEKRFGYFPQRFCWRGKSREVQAVERCWTKDRAQRAVVFSGPQRRRYIRPDAERKNQYLDFVRHPIGYVNESKPSFKKSKLGFVPHQTSSATTNSERSESK